MTNLCTDRRFRAGTGDPAVAHADFISGPTMTRRQTVDYVIARGLAQRGFPTAAGPEAISTAEPGHRHRPPPDKAPPSPHRTARAA